MHLIGVSGLRNGESEAVKVILRVSSFRRRMKKNLIKQEIRTMQKVRSAY